jgi:hypothetical protein
MSLIERVRSLCSSLPEALSARPGTTPRSGSAAGAGKIFCTAATDGSKITLQVDRLEREALLGQGDRYREARAQARCLGTTERREDARAEGAATGSR